MQIAFLLLALVALIKGTQAQTSATIQVQDSVHSGSAQGYLSTSFVGLKLPSGGGSVSITIAPGDSADGSFVTSYADHTQAGPYILGGSSTSFTISAAGHYWLYLAAYGSTSNYDWVEIRVVASTFVGTVTCTYCAPPNGWTSGWPPAGSPQETGIMPSSQPGIESKNVMVPRWVIPVLAVVIAVALLLPISYCIYRRRQNNKSMPPTPATPETPTVEMQSTTIDMQTTTVDMQTTTSVV